MDQTVGRGDPDEGRPPHGQGPDRLGHCLGVAGPEIPLVPGQGPLVEDPHRVVGQLEGNDGMRAPPANGAHGRASSLTMATVRSTASSRVGPNTYVPCSP